MKLDKNSYGTLALVYLFSVLVIISLWRWCDIVWLKWSISAIFVWFIGWQTFFFRVPKRNAAGSDTDITAVADGRIVILDKVFEPEHLKCECIQISTYMDFWDVHANFWPVSGEVTYYKYHPGKHLLAFKPKASEDNEHTCISIRTSNGQEVMFKQLAGTFARRIVSYAKPGLKVKAGEQCGIIKFGSRIDLYIPIDADIKVELGQEPRACETVIAQLQ